MLGLGIGAVVFMVLGAGWCLARSIRGHRHDHTTHIMGIEAVSMSDGDDGDDDEAPMAIPFSFPREGEGMKTARPELPAARLTKVYFRQSDW